MNRDWLSKIVLYKANGGMAYIQHLTNSFIAQFLCYKNWNRKSFFKHYNLARSKEFLETGDQILGRSGFLNFLQENIPRLPLQFFINIFFAYIYHCIYYQSNYITSLQLTGVILFLSISILFKLLELFKLLKIVSQITLYYMSPQLTGVQMYRLGVLLISKYPHKPF